MSTRLSAEELPTIEQRRVLIEEILVSWTERDAARAESVRLRAELEEVKQDRSECFREAMLAMKEYREAAMEVHELRVALKFALGFAPLDGQSHSPRGEQLERLRAARTLAAKS